MSNPNNLMLEASAFDDRDEENPEYTVNPDLSCSNTDFGGKDPAEDTFDPETPSEAATFDPRNNA